MCVILVEICKRVQQTLSQCGCWSLLSHAAYSWQVTHFTSADSASGVCV